MIQVIVEASCGNCEYSQFLEEDGEKIECLFHHPECVGMGGYCGAWEFGLQMVDTPPTQTMTHRMTQVIVEMVDTDENHGG